MQYKSLSMNAIASRLRVKWLKNGKVSLYYRGKRQFTGSFENARSFAVGFNSPIDARDVAASKEG